MMFVAAVSIILALSSAAPALKGKYEGYQHWKIAFDNPEQIQIMQQLTMNEKIIFWEELSSFGGTSEVLVSGDIAENVHTFLKTKGISISLISQNIQRNIDETLTRHIARKENRGLVYDPDDYNTFEDINAELERLSGACSEGITCSLTNVGFSYEGRDMNLFKISSGEGRQAIWIDSLIHAREWLAGATVLRILAKIVEDYSSDDAVRHLVDNYDWYFLPVMNPDGYVYTWEGDRFWRKSMTINEGSSCIGVDLNRNYDFRWGGFGSSGSECSGSYRGPSPASEPETQIVQAEGQKLSETLLMWITFHTTAQMYLMPYGNIDDNFRCERAPNHDEMERVLGIGMNALMETHDTEWLYGNSCEVLYATTGTTQDYAYGALGASYAFTPELRGPGFDPSADAIQPSFEENWNALVAMVNAIENPDA